MTSMAKVVRVSYLPIKSHDIVDRFHFQVRDKAEFSFSLNDGVPVKTLTFENDDISIHQLAQTLVNGSSRV